MVRPLPFKGRRTIKIFLTLCVSILFVLTADALFPPPIHLAKDRAVIVTDRNGEWLHAFATKDGRWRFTTALNSVDGDFIKRLLIIEDKRFFQHKGVDPIALARAMKNSLSQGRFVSGASTITMQTARLLEPKPRTIRSKFIEMVRALQIERRLSKKEILALYLTLAPYGGNIEGVRAASLLYFGKEPSSLTLSEQALLIALPQAPEARRPDRKTNGANHARNLVLSKLMMADEVSVEKVVLARAAAIPNKRSYFRNNGYHVSRRAKFIREQSDGFTQHVSDILTSLDVRIQTATHDVVHRHIMNRPQEENAAVIILHVPTGEVIASVGSAGLDRPGGWIDLTRAIRSPGSLLKPFVYGIAFDDGVLAPDTVLADTPTTFGAYSPENFDRQYRGEVRVREALQHSLNIPAVKALDQIGAERFNAVLENAGAALVLPQRSKFQGAGLPLALGGVGFRLVDAVRLYGGLQNDGVVQPLRYFPISVDAQHIEKHGTPQNTYRLLSSQSARAVTEILRNGPSLEGRVPTQLVEGAPEIAFKTGTSYGYRDAWAAGVAGKYAIAVWTGRPDGAPRPGRTGRKAAAPLLFSLFDQLGNLSPNAVLATNLASNDQEQLLEGLPFSTDALLHFNKAIEPETQQVRITFPLDGSELFSSGERGYALSATGGHLPYRWYVDGQQLDSMTNARLWTPTSEGFYNLMVVDSKGDSNEISVRVLQSL
ncbi:MAG: penicillin-binding protein 1C [Pseudomonadota bacterium]